MYARILIIYLTNAKFVFCGGLAEWSKAAVLKTVERELRRFESCVLRHFYSHYYGEVGEWPNPAPC